MRNIRREALGGAIPFVILLLLVLAGLALGTARFTPDSWSYFELSKTIFHDRFYEFNTWRSYFSDTKSASFPFGFPGVLAVIGKVLRVDPVNAVFLNAILAACTWSGVVSICHTIKLPRLYQIAAASSLVLNPAYLDEVVSGRAIPIALGLFVLAILIADKWPLLSGLAFGLSALIRFDYLFYGIAGIIGLCLFARRSDRDRLSTAGQLACGFLIGVSPWALFSMRHFGRLWASDNSWVSVSAAPAFVLDYPASAKATWATEPIAWAGRIANNILPLIQSLFLSISQVPIAATCSVLALMSIGNWRDRATKMLLPLGLLLAFCTGPYVLTGYFDTRYFSLTLLVLTVASLWLLSAGDIQRRYGKRLRPILLLSVLLSALIASKALFESVLMGVGSAEQRQNENTMIAAIAACHKKEPDTTYIFPRGPGLTTFAFKYGALSQMKIAIQPSNYKTMTSVEKTRFLQAMKPYKITTKDAKGTDLLCQSSAQ